MCMHVVPTQIAHNWVLAPLHSFRTIDNDEDSSPNQRGSVTMHHTASLFRSIFRLKQCESPSLSPRS